MGLLRALFGSDEEKLATRRATARRDAARSAAASISLARKDIETGNFHHYARAEIPSDMWELNELDRAELCLTGSGLQISPEIAELRKTAILARMASVVEETLKAEDSCLRFRLEDIEETTTIASKAGVPLTREFETVEMQALSRIVNYHLKDYWYNMHDGWYGVRPSSASSNVQAAQYYIMKGRLPVPEEFFVKRDALEEFLMKHKNVLAKLAPYEEKRKSAA